MQEAHAVIVLPALFMLGLLILASYGCYVLVMGIFSPWHLLIFPLTVLAVLLLFRAAWTGIPLLWDRYRGPGGPGDPNDTGSGTSSGTS